MKIANIFVVKELSVKKNYILIFSGETSVYLYKFTALDKKHKLIKNG